MNQIVVDAVLAFGIIVAGAVSFFIGRAAGLRGERAAHVAARTTAEEVARRLIEEATRESEALRKAAVVAGKEETIKLRESWEAEAQKRRDEIERGERRVQERDSNLDRKIDILEQREKEVGRRVSEITHRESAVVDR
jgi:ribonuclease Y